MDKDHEYPNKKNTQKSSKRKMIKQKNHQNRQKETIKNLIRINENELATKENDYVENSSETYKALDISLLNKLNSLGSNLENNQLSSNLIKKQNRFSASNLKKYKNNFHKQSILEMLMNIGNIKKP